MWTKKDYGKFRKNIYIYSPLCLRATEKATGFGYRDGTNKFIVHKRLPSENPPGNFILLIQQFLSESKANCLKERCANVRPVMCCQTCHATETRAVYVA